MFKMLNISRFRNKLCRQSTPQISFLFDRRCVIQPELEGLSQTLNGVDRQGRNKFPRYRVRSRGTGGFTRKASTAFQDKPKRNIKRLSRSGGKPPNFRKPRSLLQNDPIPNMGNHKPVFDAIIMIQSIINIVTI